MLIHNGIINLDYNPATDILITSMPDIRQIGLSEASFCLELVVENIRCYDIKYLLLDANKSVMDAEDQTYKAVTTKFAQDLTNTHLKRIARVETPDTRWEEKAAKVALELRQELNLPIEYQTFPTKAEVLGWLTTRQDG